MNKLETLAHKATVLRETAAALTRLADECFGQRTGILRARDKVRTMATTAKRQETLARKRYEEQARGSEARSKAFGF